MKKLEKLSQHIAGLHTKEIKAILYSDYNKTMFVSKLRKPDYVKARQKELSTNINTYETLSLTLAVIVATPAATLVVAPADGPAVVVMTPVMDLAVALGVVRVAALGADPSLALAPVATWVAALMAAPAI